MTHKIRHVRITTVGTLGTYLALLAVFHEVARAATVVVSIEDASFDPANVTNNVGDTVLWSNSGTLSHNVRAIVGNFNSKILAPGEEFSAGSNLPVGKYPYRCTLHANHSGQLIVQASAKATITSPTNNAVFTAPATVTIEAVTSNSAVIFSVIGPTETVTGTDGSSPFQFTATNLPAGNYTAAARPSESQGPLGTPSVISFTVKAPVGPAQLSKPILLFDGRLQFTIYGVMGQTYDIQVASTLPGHWATILTIVAPGGSFPFAEAPNQAQRFYRVVTR